MIKEILNIKQLDFLKAIGFYEILGGSALTTSSTMEHYISVNQDGGILFLNSKENTLISVLNDLEEPITLEKELLLSCLLTIGYLTPESFNFHLANEEDLYWNGDVNFANKIFGQRFKNWEFIGDNNSISVGENTYSINQLIYKQ